MKPTPSVPTGLFEELHGAAQLRHVAALRDRQVPRHGVRVLPLLSRRRLGSCAPTLPGG